ncbi:hypothetical protein PA598K_04588 [Paenibacillus sp. 598K]|nr:hypothetical protein PA598K_04588 [Paenibacillus sp. 598K]
MAAWPSDALVKLFKSTPVPDQPAVALELIAARNEYRAGQIGVRSSQAHHNLQVTVGALSGPGGAQIPAEQVSARFIDTIHLPQHTDLLPTEEQVLAPDGSMDYPDRITHDSALAELPADTTRAIWVSVYVSRSAPAGLYTGTAQLISDEGSAAVPVRVQVYGVTVPDTKDSDYRVDNWFSSAGGEPVGLEALRYQYGITEFSADWWTVMAHFADYMKKHRNNVIWVDPVGYLVPDVQIDASGGYAFDWGKFDQFVQLFIDAGAMKELHGSSLMMKQGDRYQVRTIQEVQGEPQAVYVPAQSSAAEQWLDIYLPALKAHLASKGWDLLFYQSGGDEPINDQDREDNNWFYDKVHTLAPGIRTLEANFVPTYDFEDTLDVHVVKQSNYDYEADYHKIRQDFGQSIWLYICNYPTWDYLVRNIDAPLAKTLLPHWYTFQHGIEGYLHWGFNFWNLNSASGNQPVAASSSYEAGGWSTAHLTDGVISTLPSSMGWSSNASTGVNHTEWVSVDLGQSTEIRKVTMFPRDDGDNRGYGFPVDFTIDISDDQTNWTTVVTQTGHAKPGIYDEAPSFSFAPQSARYVRIHATGLRANPHDGGAYRMQLAEIAVYGLDDVLQEADTPTPGDRWIAYPDRVNLGLYESIRGEAELEGIQDRELLSMLAQTRPDLAHNIAQALIATGTSYNSDTTAIAAARRAVLDNLTGNGANELLTDELDSFDKIFERSSALVIDGSYAATIADGDAGRVRRTSGTEQYMTYHRLNIQSFAATLYYESSAELAFYASPDNRSWTRVEAAVAEDLQTNAPWRRMRLSADDVPWGTNYLKIVFLDTNVLDWVPQLGKLEIVSGASSGPDVLTDSMDNFRWMASRSDNLIVDGSYADEIADGDAGRVRRTDGQTAYWVYQRSDIHSLQATLYYEGTYQLNVYASPDGASWTSVAPTVLSTEPASSGYPWSKRIIEASALPAGTAYIKFEIPASATSWVPQVGEVRVTSN